MDKKTREIAPERLAALTEACHVPDPLVDAETGEVIGIRWRPSDGQPGPVSAARSSDEVTS